MDDKLNVESAVRERYTAAAQTRVAALCCPVEYDKKFLEVIPQEVIDRDYGCGDPSAYLKTGETVLDLGSGSGKICFIAAQVVGPTGKVIGVDMNDEMLTLAREAAGKIAKKIGFHNVDFVKGKIQDLELNRDKVNGYLRENPVQAEADLQRFEDFEKTLRAQEPLIAADSIDVVVSNCVLNLVETGSKRRLFAEIYRVLKRGGRAVISDIVCDEEVPAPMQADPELWSGCISGAFEETAFLKAFADAGFYGIEILKRDAQPWQTVEGIEFRSVTVVAYKGKDGACWDYKEALIYKGPFSAVVDDDGHTFRRGERTAVCRKTFSIFTKAPYQEFFAPVSPLQETAASDAELFPCTGGVLLRHPKETKGEDYKLTAAACGPSSCC